MRTISIEKTVGLKKWVAYFLTMPDRHQIIEYEGTTYEELFELPEDGCQTIELRFDNKKGESYMGGDYYFIYKTSDDNYIVGSDMETREKESKNDILKRYPGAKIIRGSWATNDQYSTIVGKVMEFQQGTSRGE